MAMLVPELSLMHADVGASLLCRVFGFAPDGGLFRSGSQAVRIVQSETAEPHGRIDHIAIAVPDIDRALAAMQAQGAMLDAGITPEGVGEIAEFWDGGIRYVFLSGPEGARIELCQRKIGTLAQIGHDHVGIPCRDISAMQGFFEAQGAKLMSAVELVRADGAIPVRFLAFAGGVIELYAPQTAAHPERGLWSRLLVEGLAAEVIGPDGLMLAPL